MPKQKKLELPEPSTSLNVDKEKIVKEIKKQILDELDIEVSKKIEYETKNKLDKMEKRIYKYKNSSIIKRNIIIIILLLVIIVETKILYDNDLLIIQNKKQDEVNNKLEVDNKDPENKEKDSNEEKKDSKWYIENYSYLLDNIKTNLSNEDKYYLYKQNYNEETIKNTVRLNMAYQILSDKEKNTENSVINIKETDLQNAYKKIFGSLDKYTAENFNNDCVQFIYNQALKVYMAIDVSCNKNTYEKLENIKNIYEEENKIIIETIVGIHNKENNSLNNIEIETITDNYSGNLDEYEERLNKYKYIFELKEETYYLKEINKI